MGRIRRLVVVLGVVLAGTGSIPAAARGARATLPMPPLGSASAVTLPDGSPVWVVHQDDGKVRVLSALSTHRRYGASVLVGWCPSRPGFEDPMYQSFWKADGSAWGGPAPADLAHFEVLSRADQRITVSTREIPGQRRADVGTDAATPPTDLERPQPPCWDSRALDYNPGSTVRHDASGVPTVNPPRLSKLAVRATSSAFRLVTGSSLVVNKGSAPEICERSGRCTTLPITGITRDPRLGVDRVERLVLEGDFLVRIGPGLISDVAFVHGYKMTEPVPPVAPDGGCYNDPPPGAPTCE